MSEASAATYSDKTRNAYDIVAVDYAELVRPAMEDHEKPPQAYLLMIKA